MTEGSIDVAVVGLGFGEEFLPIYRAHPLVGRVAIVDPSPSRLAEVGDLHDIPDRFSDLAEVLATDRWDAVHILAPVSFHADYSVAVLESGRHCACAVPMATAGRYTAVLGKMVGDQVTPLGPPQVFRVVSIGQ